jgi:hypothetical protein
VAGEIITGLSALKAMLDIAKGLKDMNDAAARNAVAIELQEKILAAREAQSALAERVRELEEEVAGFKTWEAEKQRYKLTKLPPGTFVYTLKDSDELGEESHQLCEKCYQAGKKAILHSYGSRHDVEKLACLGCGSEYWVGHPDSVRRAQKSDSMIKSAAARRR